MTKYILILWQLLTRLLIVLDFGTLLYCTYLGFIGGIFVEMGFLLLMGYAFAMVISAPFFYFSVVSIYRLRSGDTSWHPFHIGTVDSSELVKQELGLLGAIAIQVFALRMGWSVLF